MKRARVVIGANFGDEGKGVTVSWLCSQGAGCVVRFNGGVNAGHTVVANGVRHVFKHLGSGTLQGVPTHLSQFFVCNPILFFEELAELKALEIDIPLVTAHPDCLVTTYVDMLINQAKEEARGDKRHGSCGIGLHETVNRSKVEALKITMGDLWAGINLSDRLREIGSRWAKYRIGKEFVSDEAIETFCRCCEAFANSVQPMGMAQAQEPIFEGAQGLLMSQDNKEFSPHLTHSYTGMRNVRTLCSQGGFDPEIFYVSRTYLTRHGMGKLPGEDSTLNYEDTTNHENRWQGPLRFAPLDGALKSRIAKDAGSTLHKLVLTHCDQQPAPIDADVYISGPHFDDVREAVRKEKAYG